MPQQLAEAPTVDVGMLIRRPPHEVFEALANPAITTRFWYTKSTGRMAEGAELPREWEMYRAPGGGCGSRRFRPTGASASPGDGYDPAHPTAVEFQFMPHENETTYPRITETGFTGDADTQVRRALDSTAASPSCSAR